MSRIIIFILVFVAHSIRLMSNLLRQGRGTSLPGLIVEKHLPWILAELGRGYDQIIFISGTNGKTTTRALLTHIYENNNVPVITNRGGANIIRGIASSLLFNLNWHTGTIAKTAILEVEEASLPILSRYIHPDILILTNIFRDQLDAYGEIDKTVNYFKDTLQHCSPMVYINGQDGKLQEAVDNYRGKVVEFSIDDHRFVLPRYEKDAHRSSKTRHDYWIAKQISIQDDQQTSFVVSNAEELLTITTSLPGIYNIYNILASCAIAYPQFGNQIASSVSSFKPVFGRGEMITIGDVRINIMLVKNPAGFDQVLDYISSKKHVSEPNIAFLINDRIADGRDVSWLWDVDFEKFFKIQAIDQIYTSGTRSLDMALRLKYAYKDSTDLTLPDLIKTIKSDNFQTPVYVLATYTAMIEFRSMLEEITNIPKITDQGQ